MPYSQKAGAGYIYLAKLYESSNHYFLVSESKHTHRKYEVLSSFNGNEEGLEKSVDVMFAILDENKNYRGLKRIN